MSINALAKRAILKVCDRDQSFGLHAGLGDSAQHSDDCGGLHGQCLHRPGADCRSYPGIIIGLIFMAYNFAYCKKHGIGDRSSFELKRLGKAFLTAIPALLTL